MLPAAMRGTVFLTAGSWGPGWVPRLARCTQQQVHCQHSQAPAAAAVASGGGDARSAHSAAAAGATAPQPHAPSPPPQQQQPPPPPPTRREIERRARLAPTAHRERIAADGRLIVARAAYQQQAAARAAVGAAAGAPAAAHLDDDYPPLEPSSSAAQQHPRPPGLAAAAPAAPPLPQARLEELVDLIAGARSVLVVTGAGVSTESNIPDYRGPSGAYTTGFTPMTHAQFMAKPENRARYWHRSFCGWPEFAGVQPNAAHEALARLQQRGWVGHVVTQNVDRLHHTGGSPAARVLELHGTTHRVVCMSCGAESCRHDMQRRLAALNPAAAEYLEQTMRASSEPGRWRRALRAGTAADARATTEEGGNNGETVPVRRPDGDVELVDAGRGFVVPPCSDCGEGILKPAVVFFGDSVDPRRKEDADQLARSCDLFLAVGTSLMVWSAFRLAKAAHEGGARLALVCVGDTRADGMAHWKGEALAGEVLSRLAAHPRLLLPRV